MTVEGLINLVKRYREDISFVIGNGINRYNNANNNSWEDILLNIWETIVPHETLSEIPKGTTNTEFYDILDLLNVNKVNLEKLTSQLLDNWSPTIHHRRILNNLIDLDVPVLTTNFENGLTLNEKVTLYKIDDEDYAWSDYYPWSSYFGLQKHRSPIDGFGVWHINGMIHYHRSIRLGLSQYLRSMQKANGLIHQNEEKSIFRGKDVMGWKGRNTWLHLIFNTHLFIVGLGLHENETFLRWLLIQRSKYFRKFVDRKYKGWYLCSEDEANKNKGRTFFLKNVGIETIALKDHHLIYDEFLSNLTNQSFH